MLAWLVRQQDADGGFNFATRGGLSDVDDTGSALEALAGAGGSAAARARARAIRYLRGQQDRDGGFPGKPGAGSNAQSTAFAVQGLLAAGVDPSSLHRAGAPSPLDYLRSLIAADGHVRYSRGTDQSPTWVTGEALMALDGKPLPVAAVARRSAPPAAASRNHPHDRGRAGAGARGPGTTRRARRTRHPARGADRGAAGDGGGDRPARSRRRRPDGAEPGVRRRQLNRLGRKSVPSGARMQIGVPKETAEGERRVALVPEVVRKLTGGGEVRRARGRGRAWRGRRCADPGRPVRGGGRPDGR